MFIKVVVFFLIVSLTACGGEPLLSSQVMVETPAFYPTSPPAYPARSASPGTFQPTACRFALPDDLQEGEDVECGYLTVKEGRGDEENQSSRLIQLAVAIFHPSGGATHPDPVIYLSGGPGASALELIRYQFEALSEAVFTSGRDLIVFDQRGVGLSQPALDCPGFDELSLDLMDREVDGSPVSEDEILDLYLASLETCRVELSKTADLTAYNTAASARDVNELIQALGYQEANLWGGSYGTRLALEVMRRYPDPLRSVVLEAVYPPDVDLYVEAPANFNRALEKLFEACASNQVCNRAYPDLREVFFDTVSHLNSQPVLREIENPFTGEKYQGWMDGNTLLGLTFQLLYDSRIRYLIPQYIYAASQDDYTTFDLTRGSLIGLIKLSSRGMMFSVQCHDELPFSSPDEFHAALSSYSELGTMYDSSLLGGMAYRACETWGAGVADPTANQPVTSDLPTLVMSGEFDPITPPEWGQRAARHLENSYSFEFPGAGHGASGAGSCPRQMMIAFLDQPAIKPDSSCMSQMY
jgi:pimeloyl-ACP methyl ester carboxylesterase